MCFSFSCPTSVIPLRCLVDILRRALCLVVHVDECSEFRCKFEQGLRPSSGCESCLKTLLRYLNSQTLFLRAMNCVFATVSKKFSVCPLISFPGVIEELHMCAQRVYAYSCAETFRFAFAKSSSGGTPRHARSPPELPRQRAPVKCH